MSVEEFRKRRHHRKLVTCTHFHGIQHDVCKAGVRYRDVKGTGPYSCACIRDDYWERGGKPECSLYEAESEEAVAAEEAAQSRAFKLIAENLSPCCEASLDERQVITSGRHKGHGPRFCSKCGVLVYLV